MDHKDRIIYRLINIVNNAEFETNDTIIAKGMLENRHHLNAISLDQFSKQYYVSQPSISRFIKKLGFDNYNEFRQKMAVSEYVIGQHHATEKSDFEVLKQQTYDSLLRATMEIQDYQSEQFTNLINHINAYNTIYFIGSELSMSVLALLQYKMISMGKDVYLIHHDVYQIETIHNCHKDELLVAVSIDDRWLSLIDPEVIKTCKADTMLWTVESDSKLHDSFDEKIYFGKHIDANIGYHQLMQFEMFLFHML